MVMLVALVLLTASLHPSYSQEGEFMPEQDKIISGLAGQDVTNAHPVGTYMLYGCLKVSYWPATFTYSSQG